MLIFLTMLTVIFSAWVLYRAEKADLERFNTGWEENDDLWRRI